MTANSSLTADTADALEVHRFSEQVHDDVLTVVNRYVEGWPYSRPIERSLFARWATVEAFQPENVWLARHEGRPVAFLHGQFEQDVARVHLLAVMPGEAVRGAQLLARFEAHAHAAGLPRVVGPQWLAQKFYGSHVIGHEPYHPHWAVEASEAFVRAGFEVNGAVAFMVRDLSREIVVEPSPAGYRIVSMPGYGGEHGAETFSYRAFHGEQEVAHCYGRLFPDVKAPNGKPVGQLGHVGTDEDHRGKGLARRMVNASLAHLRDMGAAEVLITTGMDNQPAVKAYERAGFDRRHFLITWAKPRK